MQLFSRRKAQEEKAKAEAAGRNLWTASFSTEFRIGLIHSVIDRCGESSAGSVLENARFLLTRSLRRPVLLDAYVAPQQDMANFIEKATDDQMPDVIEALVAAVEGGDYGYLYQTLEPWVTFPAAVREMLAEDRIQYDLIEGKMHPLDSQVMHRDVVLPTLSLLSGKKGLAGAEAAFQDALREISERHADDAIVDAARALQEVLGSLGCHGGSLGDQLRSPRGRELLARHDARIADSIKSAVDWANAQRSERGDVHKATDAELADARMTLHIVGALILRLAETT